MSKIQKECVHCGSPNVLLDAWAKWDVGTQRSGGAALTVCSGFPVGDPSPPRRTPPPIAPLV